MTGTKHDNGKPPWHLLPYDAIDPIVRVLAFGANKYAERNWERGLAHSRTFAATQRHLVAWWHGEDDDPETKISHLAHAACEILFALAFVVRGRWDLDDRPGRVAPAPASTPEATAAPCAFAPVYPMRDRLVALAPDYLSHDMVAERAARIWWGLPASVSSVDDLARVLGIDYEAPKDFIDSAFHEAWNLQADPASAPSGDERRD